jgi:uncharacterized DUF497 family protein
MRIYIVRYEWDEEKNRRHQRKHGGISFELAALVFEDERCIIGLDRVDKRGNHARTRSEAFTSGSGSPLCCWLCTPTGRISW